MCWESCSYSCAADRGVWCIVAASESATDASIDCAPVVRLCKVRAGITPACRPSGAPALPASIVYPTRTQLPTLTDITLLIVLLPPSLLPPPPLLLSLSPISASLVGLVGSQGPEILHIKTHPVQMGNPNPRKILSSIKLFHQST